MKRSTVRTVLRSVLPTGFCLLLASAYLFGRDTQEVDVEVHPVAGSVSYLVGQGGNIGISAGDDGVLMIDDQFARLSDEIEGAIDELSESQPVFLVNTHWHGDHTGGNEHFGAQATILAHENVRRRLARDTSIGGRVSESMPPKVALPTVTYADGLSIFFNDEEIRLIHVPTAHTDGDTVVWFTGSNTVHLGDLYFQVGYPFIDLDSGGNALGLIEGLRGLLRRLPADVRVIPGHGELTGVEGLKEYLEMLETILDRVRVHLEEGLSVKEMIDAGVTADYDERWGSFDFVPAPRFVESLVRSLRE